MRGMNDAELAAIEARAAAATPGPWVRIRDHRWASDIYVHADARHDVAGRPVARVNEHYTPDVDAEFIAHARQDVPALLAEVRRLRGAIEDYAENRIGSNALIAVLDGDGVER